MRVVATSEQQRAPLEAIEDREAGANRSSASLPMPQTQEVSEESEDGAVSGQSSPVDAEEDREILEAEALAALYAKMEQRVFPDILPQELSGEGLQRDAAEQQLSFVRQSEFAEIKSYLESAWLYRTRKSRSAKDPTTRRGKNLSLSKRC